MELNNSGKMEFDRFDFEQQANFGLSHDEIFRIMDPDRTVLTSSIEREFNENMQAAAAVMQYPSTPQVPGTPYTPSIYTGSWVADTPVTSNNNNAFNSAFPSTTPSSNFMGDNSNMNTPVTFDVNKTAQSSFFPPTATYQPQTPQQQQPNPSQQLLNEIHQHQLEQKDRIEKMYQNQRQFMNAPQEAGYNIITTEQTQLKARIESELQTLNTLYDTVILDPPDLQKLLWLRQDLEVQMKQLDLLIYEIRQLTQPQNNANRPCLASLVILKQPFPQVVSKNKQLTEDQLQVQLLTASNLQVQSISQVKATLLCDANQGKGASSKLLEGDIQNLNTNSRIAKFPLKFLAGTKKAAANIRFAMQLVVNGNAVPATIESNSSFPLVVITNECQWEGSAGTLLRKEAFSSGMEIQWARFANTLQYHFLKATRQDMSRPRRILSNFDINFLHARFFGKKTLIGQKDFDAFWEWFGKAMQKIRYQRHIGSLWQNGLLYGFMGRDDVNYALHNQDPGTFIVRFSESHPGQFAITYIGNEQQRIKHYLVQPNDTAASKKTLPDFLEERREFMTLLVFTYDQNGRPSFVRSPKEIALEPYCGKKQQLLGEDPTGYDPL